MRLTVRQLAKINRAVAAEHNGQIEIDTAAPAGGSDFVEVLVTVRQSHVIRVPRTDAETYEKRRPALPGEGRAVPEVA